MQCTVTVSSAVHSATQPDTSSTDDTAAAAAAAAADAAAANVEATGEVCDSWQMDCLNASPALLQPVKYPPMHIFVSGY